MMSLILILNHDSSKGTNMLMNVDAKHLDWTTAVFLSQDEIGMKEIREGFDLHTDNQKVFGLPSRLIAKVFLFRLIFGGSSGGFANDADFSECKFSVKQWDAVIEKFYRKYKGIHKWHEDQVRIATTTGKLTIPTGRTWIYQPTRDSKGELKQPITTIKNYPVQGLEADLMSLARVSLYGRIKRHADPRILIINSVHDSILLDVPADAVDWVSTCIASVFHDVPANFKRLFGVDFNLPFRGELLVGEDWLTMEEVKGLDWG
jgi:DNA polymerase I-like protein with 3'-5' exonuclease and polymerase domains